MTVDMKTTFCGLSFKNPLVAASTDMSREEDAFITLLESGVGAVVTKSVTDAQALQSKGIARFDIRGAGLEPLRGQVPREYTFFSRGGSMVSMETFRGYAADQLKEAKARGVILIGSISASRVENWVSYAKEMEAMGFPMLELNFGNPHGEAADGKLGFLIGQSKELGARIAGSVRQAVKIPVLVKLTPQVDSVAEMAEVLNDVGIEAVTVMHRYQGLIPDLMAEEASLGGWAAVGGTWMKPISLGNVAKVYRKLPQMSICGGNGADTGRDVLEFIACGAGLVQIGSTLMLRGPEEVGSILSEMEALCRKKNLSKLETLKGRIADKIVTYANLSQLPERKSRLDAEICLSCGEKPCLDRCYFGSLTRRLGVKGRREDKCTGCGMCLHICPKGAVSMVEEGEMKS